jgi:hypothetical protein
MELVNVTMKRAALGGGGGGQTDEEGSTAQHSTEEGEGAVRRLRQAGFSHRKILAGAMFPGSSKNDVVRPPRCGLAPGKVEPEWGYRHRCRC